MAEAARTDRSIFERICYGIYEDENAWRRVSTPEHPTEALRDELYRLAERGLKWDFNLHRMPPTASRGEVRVFASSDMDELLTEAARTTVSSKGADPWDEGGADHFRYCVVQCLGHVVHDRCFYRELVEAVPLAPFLVMGDLLTASDGGESLVATCFVVDLDTYRELGAPSFDRAGASRVAFGAGLMEAGRRAGMPVRRLPRALHRHRFYLSPADAGDAGAAEPFFAAIRTHDAAVDMWKDNIFIYNTESVCDEEIPPGREVTCMVGLPSGFKLEYLAFRSRLAPRAEVIYYDFSVPALRHRRELLQRWDGASYEDFNDDFRRRFEGEFNVIYAYMRPREGIRREALWQKSVRLWGGEEAFREFWRGYREYRHQFVHVDILSSPDRLLERIPRDGFVVIWWSNIFDSVWTARSYRYLEIRSVYLSWLQALRSHNPDVFCVGVDVFNRGRRGMMIDERLQLETGFMALNLPPSSGG